MLIICAFAEGQFDPALADPRVDLGWVPVNERVRGDIFGDHRPRPDERISAQRRAANDGRVRPDGRPAPDEGFQILAASIDVAARVDHVREDHRGSQKNIIFENHAGVDRNIILNFDVIPDLNIVGNENILPDIAAFADLGLGHDVAKMPNARAFANFSAFI